MALPNNILLFPEFGEKNKTIHDYYPHLYKKDLNKILEKEFFQCDIVVLVGGFMFCTYNRMTFSEN